MGQMGQSQWFGSAISTGGVSLMCVIWSHIAIPRIKYQVHVLMHIGTILSLKWMLNFTLPPGSYLGL